MRNRTFARSLLMVLVAGLITMAQTARAQTEPASVDSLPKNQIAYMAPDQQCGDYGLWRMNTDGSNPVLWRQGCTDLHNFIEWSPDGSRIAYDNDEEDGGWNAVKIENLSGGSFEVGEGENDDEGSPTWSPDGKQLAVSYTPSIYDDGHYHIRIFDSITGAVLGDLTSFQGNVLSLDWSPDGTAFAFSGIPAAGGLENIYRMSVSGGSIRQLTVNGGTTPEWSPDGSKIAYTAPASGDAHDIFVMKADGSGPVNLTHSVADERRMYWAPDGTKLVFGRLDSSSTTGWNIWVMNMDGSQQQQLTQGYGDETDPAWQGRPNVLFNDSFEGGESYWHFQTNGRTGFATAQPGYKSTTAGKITVTQATSQIQLFEKSFRLEPKTRYQLRFAAYASAGHDLSVYLNSHSNPSLNYGLSNFRFNLTAGWQLYSVEFTTKNFTALTTDTRLRFWLGPFAKSGDVYWIDNVSLARTPMSATAITAAQSVGSIHGKIEAPAPMMAALTVTLVDLDSDGATYQATGQPDADGLFQFENVPQGTYELRPSAVPGYPLLEPVQLAVDDEPNEEIVFSFSNTDETGTTLFLPTVMR